MSEFSLLKQQAYDANMCLPREGLVIHTFGNVSAIDRDKGVIAIKPSGVPYDLLQPEDMVVVDMENKVLEGKLRPSSDTKTHVYLYKIFQEIGGICHTHSTHAVAWAQAIRPIPNFGTTHADHLTSEIPVTKLMTDEMIKGDYELETGKQIEECFNSISYKEVEMVLVASHGPFTWGASAKKAVYNAAILEELAKIAILTLQINPAAATIQKSLIDKHYDRKHGQKAYYGQKKE